MSMFLIGAALLALLASAVLTRPLWWRGGDAPARGASQDAPSVPARSPGLAAALSVLVVGVAAAGYAWLGTPAALDATARAVPDVPAGDSHAVTRAQIEAMVEGLAERMKGRPDDVDGWVMLGRSYAVLGQHDKALPAFRRAAELRADDPVLLADYADALAVANGRSLEGEPARLIERALSLDPRNLKALSMAGTLAFDRRDYAGAVRHWQQMLAVAPDGEIVRQIQGGIDEARQRMGGTSDPVASPSVTRGATAPETAPPAPAAASAKSVSGRVTLSGKLASQAAPDDTVFVFARPAEGPRMPLAILRKKVRDLPLTFTLDDSMAMSPAARLSSATRVVVGARISKSGDATAQPGDLQGFSAAVAPGATGLVIEIGEVVGR
jgi:cytochrome c-type biogenesis protein CcmH